MKQKIDIDSNGKMIVIRELLVPGNEVKPGVWEGHVSGMDIDCDYFDVKLCQHEHAFQSISNVWVCPKCKARMVEEDGIKGVWK